MDSNGLGWHHPIVTTISDLLLRELTSNNNIDFHCLDCVHSLRTKNKLEFHEKVCENK